jgi:hypothetical protein
MVFGQILLGLLRSLAYDMPERYYRLSLPDSPRSKMAKVENHGQWKPPKRAAVASEMVNQFGLRRLARYCE